MNGIATKPLTARIAAHPIAARLARLGKPVTLAEAGVAGGFKSALAFDVPQAVAA